MMSIGFLEEFPYIFTQGGQIRRARLLRSEEPGQLAVPTDVNIQFGGETSEWYMEIRGIRGELPANIKLLEFDSGEVLFSSEQEPDNWQQLEPNDDVYALRVLSLLDPRLVIQNADMSRTEILSDGDDTRTSFLLHVNLHDWKPQLPDDFVAWLKGNAYDRLVTLHFDHDRLVRTIQRDLPPWQTDGIIAEYE